MHQFTKQQTKRAELYIKPSLGFSLFHLTHLHVHFSVEWLDSYGLLKQYIYLKSHSFRMHNLKGYSLTMRRDSHPACSFT